MQIQLGKRRRELEAAFEDRTAELRTVTECKSHFHRMRQGQADFEDSPGGIFRCDGDGEVIYANSAWYVCQFSLVRWRLILSGSNFPDSSVIDLIWNLG